MNMGSLSFPDAGKDRGQKEKRVSEDEMAGRHHRCNEHECRQTLGDGVGRAGLECCSPWGHKEPETTERLNNNTGSLIVANIPYESRILTWRNWGVGVQRLPSSSCQSKSALKVRFALKNTPAK